MRVAILVPSLQEKGPIIVAENIAKYANKEADFLFISLRINSLTDKQRFTQYGFNIQELGMGKLPTLRVWKQLEYLLDLYQPDILHAHCFWPTVLTAKCNFKGKRVVTIHNNPYEDLFMEYGNIIGYLMCKTLGFTLKRFDKIVAISDYLISAHQGFALQGKFELIYNGIEDCYCETYKDKNVEDTIRLLSPAVLIPRKNIITAVQAVKKAIDRGCKISYVIVGDGEQKQMILEFIKQYSLENCIKLLGKLPRQQVFEQIRLCDGVIIPSLSEGLPLAVIEAMMLEKPVIASDIAAMHVLVKHGGNGYICESTDIEQFCEAILHLQDQNNRKALGQEARKTYLEKFTVQTMATGYIDLYRSLVGNK